LPAYTEQVAVKLVPGTKKRIERAARRAAQAPAEWLRSQIRRGLESSERAARRAAARQKR